MDDKLKALAEHVSAALSGAVLSSEIRHGELACRIKREDLLRVLGFLRDDRIRATDSFVDKAFNLAGKVKPDEIYTNELLK